MEKGTAEYELGRYMKKVEDQEKEIRELEMTVEGYVDALRADDAIVAAVVKACGEVVVSQEDINSALAAKLGVSTVYDIESRTYTLRTVVKKDGEEQADCEECSPTEQG